MDLPWILDDLRVGRLGSSVGLRERPTEALSGWATRGQIQVTLTIQHVVLFVTVLADVIVVIYTCSNPAIVLLVVVVGTGLALATAIDTADASPRPEGLEAALS